MNIHLGSLAALLAASVLAVACASPAPAAAKGKTTGDRSEQNEEDEETPGKTSSKPSDEKPPIEAGDAEELKDMLFPMEIHTGFTGGSETFVVSLDTDIKGPLTWSVADPSIAEVVEVPPPAGYTEARKEDPTIPELTFAKLTTKKDGTTKVIVKGATKTAESPVVVKKYTSAAVALGQTRYRTGEGTGNRQACANCHEKGLAPDHSPAWMSNFDDEDIVSAITTAVYAKDTEKYQLRKGDHKWNLTEEEKTAIMAFMRSLPLEPVVQQ